MNLLKESVRNLGLCIVWLFVGVAVSMLYIFPFGGDPRMLWLEGDVYWFVFSGLCVAVVLWFACRWLLLIAMAVLCAGVAAGDVCRGEYASYVAIWVSLSVSLLAAGLIQRQRDHRPCCAKKEIPPLL